MLKKHWYFLELLLYQFKKKLKNVKLITFESDHNTLLSSICITKLLQYWLINRISQFKHFALLNSLIKQI